MTGKFGPTPGQSVKTESSLTNDAVSLSGCPMSALYLLACVALIVTLGYIGVSWAVAGAGLCVLATIALCLAAGR
jgi:hypothetical protein